MDRSEISIPSTLLPHEDAPSIGYLCPLYTELAAVIFSFDEYLGSQEVGEDEYHYGRIGSRRAVGVHFDYGEMGPITAAEYASRLVLAHPSLKNPRSICLLVGIAGGLWTEERDVRLGDVVIGTRIWDWRAGKQTSHGLETTSFPKEASKRLRRRLPSFLYDRDTLEKSIAQQVKTMREKDRKNDLKWTYQGHTNDRLYLDSYLNTSGSSETTQDVSNLVRRAIRPADHPKVHDGLIASGNVVLKDAVNRKSLLEKRVYAVEMEACGVPNDFIVVRGVSDYADSHKNDIWQPYAAAVAAACARLLVDHFAASADQDVMYVHRLNSDPSNVSWPEASRTMSNSSLATNDKDGLLTHEPPTVLDNSNLESNIQPNRRPPPLPARPASKASETAQSFSRITASTDTSGDRTKTDAEQYILPQYGEVLYSGIWKRATRKIFNHSKTPPVLWTEKSWELPRLTMYLHKADPAYTSKCFLVFCTSADGNGDLHDRAWLPLSGLRFGFVGGQMQIVYETFLNNDDPLASPTWLPSGHIVRMQLLLEPQGNSVSNPEILVKQLLFATMTPLPDAITTNSAATSNAELAHGIIHVGGDRKHVLYIHQVDASDMHYCALVAFSTKMNFRINVLSNHIELLLKEMQSLQYDIALPSSFGLKSDQAAPSVKIEWINMKQTYRINRPPLTVRDLLNQAIAPVVGWKAVSTTRGIQVVQMTDRAAMPFAAAALGKTVAKVFNTIANKWDTYLFAWQKDDQLRFILTSNMIFESVDKSANSQIDGWTISAGSGEMFKQSSSSGKWKVAFELKVRSREGSYISLTPDSWFELPASHRISCADSIVLSFPNAAVYDTFCKNIDERFWRK